MLFGTFTAFFMPDGVEKSRGRGVIPRYRDYLPVTDATPIVSLGEGETAPGLLGAFGYRQPGMLSSLSSGLTSGLDNPAVMFGLGLASGRTPQEGFGNAALMYGQIRPDHSKIVG